MVGDQSSMAEVKQLTGQYSNREAALDRIIKATKTGLHSFRYKDGRYHNEEFTGLVLGEGFQTEHYEKDQGKALNEINAIGDIFAAISLLAEESR